MRSLNSAFVEEVRLRSQDMHDVEIETEHRGDGLHPDFGRGEPFQAFAAVEQHLQPDHAERKGRQAEEVEGRILLGFFSERSPTARKMKPDIGRLI